MSPTTIHPTPGHYPANAGVRVDLGNHMVGTDSLHTILRPENPRNLNTKSYYYGWQEEGGVLREGRPPSLSPVPEVSTRKYCF